MAARGSATGPGPASSASFDLLILGCGGGPSEDNLSAYLIKPKQQDWKEGFISVDAGSCLGALSRLLDRKPESFHDFDLPEENNGSILANVGYIFDKLTGFLITHAHWDHISGLVISSGSGAGQKYVYGSRYTMDNLSTAMNGNLWPSLGSYDEKHGLPYVWRRIEPGAIAKPGKGLNASLMPVSHGRHHSATSYQSTAYFVGNEYDGRSVLVFGDLEADSVSGEHFNRDVWREASTRLAANKLSTMLIECSYDSTRPKEQLYGHLSPLYIFEELRILAGFMPPSTGQDPSDLRGRLKDLTIGIMHVKDPTSLAECVAPSLIPSLAGVDQETSSMIVDNAGTALQKVGAISLSPRLKKRKSASQDGSNKKIQSQTPTRTTRSSSSKKAVDPGTEEELLKTPEGVRKKILRELQAIEAVEQLGCTFVMLEQGMRLDA